LPRTAETPELRQAFFRAAQESTTGDLIEFWCRQGYAFVDVLKMLGLEVRVAPRQHLDFSDWLNHHQDFDHEESHDNFGQDFDG
jgi:hypothetical protein